MLLSAIKVSLIFLTLVAMTGSEPANLEEAITQSRICSAGNTVENQYALMEFKKVDGALFLRVKIKDVLSFQKLAGQECFGKQGSPIAWHLHVKSKFPQSIGVGHEVCGPPTTGGHVDPGLACGPSSGNALCKDKHIPPSSSLTNNTSGKYQCTPEIYARSGFACEAGDFAGKYGNLLVPPIKRNTMTFTIFAEDLHDGLNPCELVNTSLVLHCGITATRALCMKLDVKSESRSMFYLSIRKHAEEIMEYGNFASDVLNIEDSE